MATVISKEEAYAHLSDVLDRAMRGEEIEIEQGGKTKVKLVPVATEPVLRRQFGQFGPISDANAEESIRPLSRDDLGMSGDDDDWAC